MSTTQYYYFTEQPYTGYDPAVQEEHPALRLTLPNSLYDAELASELYNRYHDEYQVADEVGFDGIMINEHHTAPFCMQASINITGAVLAKITRRAKIIMLGNPLPVVDNPLRLAEELAMIDCISRGRLVSGVVRGGGVESLANNVNPAHNRERFEEAHDLIVAAWTRPGPFRWEGKHFQYRVVNPWALPLQKPHPPIMVPGTASPETVIWAARHRYPYIVLGSFLEQTQELIQIYRETAEEVGYEMQPENIGYLIRCFVSDTEEHAQEQGKNFFWQNGALNKQPREWMAPPGYATVNVAGDPAPAGGVAGLRLAGLRGGAEKLPGGGRHAGSGHREAALRARPARRRAHVPVEPRRLHDPPGHGAEHRTVRQGGSAGSARRMTTWPGVRNAVHRLERQQFVPRPREEVFAFFADAQNLEMLTPAFLNFRILTPLPLDMRSGSHPH